MRRVPGVTCGGVLLLVLASCVAGHRPPVTLARARLAAPRPARCVTVPAGEPLAESVARASAGDALCLAPGVHPGPAVLDKPVHLWGTRDAVVRSDGRGTTLLVTAAHTSLTGFTVDGSGRRYDLDDAAVKIRANDVRVEGLRIVHATFGILGEQLSRAVIRGNEVLGDPALPFGLRGDSIRLWEGRDSTVSDNVVTNGRDVVLWYSSHNRFLRNRVSGSRYGTHLMYSHDNDVRDNVYRHDVVGIFVMYSRGLRLVHNQFVDIAGAAGMGIGLKEAGNIEVRQNRFVHAASGLYVDTSPLSNDDHDVVVGNEFVYCDTAITFHGRADRNTFRGNTLRDNRVQVAFDGGGDALSADWDGNYFDDYTGYDLDGDGIGDVPHAQRSLATDVVGHRPILAFFTGTPALGVVDAIGRLVPLFAPRTVLVDSRPAMAPVEPSDAP